MGSGKNLFSSATMVFPVRSRLASAAALAALFGMALLPSLTVAAPIVSDAFGGSNAAAVTGRTPDAANLPGGTYVTRNYFGQAAPTIDTSVGSAAPSAVSSANNLTYISIGSTGGYTKPTLLHVAADLRTGNLNVDANTLGSLDVGFLIADPGGADNHHIGTQNGFNGVRMLGNGTLQLKTAVSVANGGGENITTISAYDAGTLGAFDANAFYSVSYDVDTTSGDVSNIQFKRADSGPTVTYDAVATSFTAANTNLAAFESGSAGGGRLANFDNFQIAEVPEPGTLGLLGLAAVVGLARRRRRR